MHRKAALCLLAIAMTITLACTAVGITYAQTGDYIEPPSEHARARVIRAMPSAVDQDSSGMEFEATSLVVEILSGRFKGRTLSIEHVNSGHPGYDFRVNTGDTVVLWMELRGDDIAEAYVQSVARDSVLSILIGAYVVLLVLIGGLKGFKAALALVITIVAVIGVLLPLLLRGYSPILVAVLTASATTILTMAAVGGVNRKTLTAVMGTMSGVVFAALIALRVGAAAQLTGFNTEEARMLLYIPQQVSLDFRGLLFAGVIIGALGAVMDVAMSVASSMEEVRRVSPRISPGMLFGAGMNVGRDVIGTMSNTLILAYTGSAIPLLLLFLAYDTPLIRIINSDLMATEIVRALAGSIGLVMAVPATAAVGSYMLARDSRRGRTKEQ